MPCSGGICLTPGFNCQSPGWYGCPFLLGGMWGCADSHSLPIRPGEKGKHECRSRKRKLKDNKEKTENLQLSLENTFSVSKAIGGLVPIFLGNSLVSMVTTGQPQLAALNVPV